MFQNKRYQQNQRAYRKKGLLSATLNNVCLFIFIAKFFMIRPRTPLIFLEHSDPCGWAWNQYCLFQTFGFLSIFIAFSCLVRLSIKRASLYLKSSRQFGMNVYERWVCTMKCRRQYTNKALSFIYSIQIVL